MLIYLLNNLDKIRYYKIRIRYSEVRIRYYKVRIRYYKVRIRYYKVRIRCTIMIPDTMISEYRINVMELLITEHRLAAYNKVSPSENSKLPSNWIKRAC